MLRKGSRPAGNPLNPSVRHWPERDPRSRAPDGTSRPEPGVRVVLDGLQVCFASASVHTPASTPGRTVTVQPGAGERAEPPARIPERPAAPGHRPFQEPILAWIAEGTDGWWRTEIEGMPPSGRDRRRKYTAIRNAWMHEIDRQRARGRLPIEAVYRSRLRTEDGRTFFTWGPPDTGVPGE